MRSLPVVDLTAASAAADADRACREVGFFYVVGHGVDAALQRRLEEAAWSFFRRPESEKASIAMARGGRAWRGWFPVGGELTSGKPDRKEGVYFGAERPPSDVPLRGPNLFASSAMRDVVLAWLDAMTALGHRLASLVGVDGALLAPEPTVLFRIFHYPPGGDVDGEWGVGEHTDYGLLTILAMDDVPGLQVRARDGGWIDAPPLHGAFLVNLGDMLERLTGGAYRSTPHRVRNTSDVGRLSFPFFFDPAWTAHVPVPDGALPPEQRWDGADVLAGSSVGAYGDYLVAKVSKVFPALAGEQL
ncbi:MAG TPA: 2OG-Fe(II) oxygenase family protein [Acidimicrobiales bacterium]|nr:2OG-Fe(II) oxygenase family protein [Acidimicrobiales bacterium]